MISAKISTKSESFNGFGRGRRIDLAISHGYTHIYVPLLFPFLLHLMCFPTVLPLYFHLEFSVVVYGFYRIPSGFFQLVYLYKANIF